MSGPVETQAVAAATASEASSVLGGKQGTSITEVLIPKSEPIPQTNQAEEPQNALTKEFTEEEWVALKDFRSKLPEIFRAVYTPDDPEAELKPVTIWGVILDPKNPASDARVSVFLMKFLRARELRIEDAQVMLTATLKWRHEMNIDAIMKEDFPEKIFSGVGRIFGKDKGGRPVVYNIYGGEQDVSAVFGDVKRFIRWRVQLMEKSIELLNFETLDQMVQVHDYEGVSMFGRTANQKAAASEATAIFQNHYPEFLFKKLFINVPAFLTWMFWIFKPIISAKTYAKMSVVGTGQPVIAEAMLPLIDAQELPKRYGGEAEGF
ncbi:hypothetical protein NM688_g6003 [Phlebia brevispora]|uniref:Uncharacterized protein n=1 Tax=Phlebia brevispora TaxID=194682 RepID=A0ACC1SLB4_9APHY|nr:hypothetical protein NM688_g6003 [Phlebia brevispora]